MKSRLFIVLIVLLSACLDDTVSTSQYEQLLNDIEKIDAYLLAHPPAPTDFVVKDASGVTVVFSQVGTGLIPPNPDNELILTYTGRLLSNGSIFDSRDASDPFYFIMSKLSVINGWKIALSMMTEGAVAKVYIPSVHAYGTRGSSGTIPGNAVLVFDIELLSVEPTTAQVNLLATQRAAIDVKLEGVENVINDPSGIRIIHTQLGSGSTPGPYSQVVISYSAKLVSNDTEVMPLTQRGPSVDFSSRTINYLHGLMIGMQQMQAGGKAKIYIPAILAYGGIAVPNIPANSNLVYEVEIEQVIE